MPQAAQFAWAGFVNQASGIAMVKAGPGADLDALWKAVRERPGFRSLFVQEDQGQPAGTFQLCVGSTCLRPSRDPPKALKGF